MDENPSSTSPADGNGSGNAGDGRNGPASDGDRASAILRIQEAQHCLWEAAQITSDSDISTAEETLRQWLAREGRAFRQG